MLDPGVIGDREPPDLTGILGTEHGSSGKAAGLLTSEPSCQPLRHTF